jgi:hypothetical protein
MRASVGAWAAVGVPLVLGVLQLTHPTWTDASVSEAVVAAGAWWTPLHVLLIGGYVALALTLWSPGVFARALLALGCARVRARVVAEVVIKVESLDQQCAVGRRCDNNGAMSDLRPRRA